MFRDQIEKGVAWLDQKFPDWLKQINLERLDLQKPQIRLVFRDECGCVLAQVDACTNIRQLGYGSYFNLTPDLDTAVRLGFNLSMTDSSPDNPKWATLTQEWKDKILELRAERFGA